MVFKAVAQVVRKVFGVVATALVDGCYDVWGGQWMLQGGCQDFWDSCQGVARLLLDGFYGVLGGYQGGCFSFGTVAGVVAMVFRMVSMWCKLHISLDRFSEAGSQQRYLTSTALLLI